ncbi:MAG: hypothetical protein PHS37_05260 [Candidatus Omnitrophica bacterium]|nr:hypothetical protein [Candidatus Omnitrophota bacterium]
MRFFVDEGVLAAVENGDQARQAGMVRRLPLVKADARTQAAGIRKTDEEAQRSAEKELRAGLDAAVCLAETGIIRGSFVVFVKALNESIREAIDKIAAGKNDRPVDAGRLRQICAGYKNQLSRILHERWDRYGTSDGTQSLKAVIELLRFGKFRYITLELNTDNIINDIAPVTGPSAEDRPLSWGESAIIKAIVRLQRPYLESGDITDLRQLSQGDLAQETGIDVTRISRMLAGKREIGYNGRRFLLSTLVNGQKFEHLRAERIFEQLCADRRLTPDDLRGFAIYGAFKLMWESMNLKGGDLPGRNVPCVKNRIIRKYLTAFRSSHGAVTADTLPRPGLSRLLANVTLFFFIAAVLVSNVAAKSADGPIDLSAVWAIIQGWKHEISALALALSSSLVVFGMALQRQPGAGNILNKEDQERLTAEIRAILDPYTKRPIAVGDVYKLWQKRASLETALQAKDKPGTARLRQMVMDILYLRPVAKQLPDEAIVEIAKKIIEFVPAPVTPAPATAPSKPSVKKSFAGELLLLEELTAEIGSEGHPLAPEVREMMTRFFKDAEEGKDHFIPKAQLESAAQIFYDIDYRELVIKDHYFMINLGFVAGIRARLELLKRQKELLTRGRAPARALQHNEEIAAFYKTFLKAMIIKEAVHYRQGKDKSFMEDLAYLDVNFHASQAMGISAANFGFFKDITRGLVARQVKIEAEGMKECFGYLRSHNVVYGMLDSINRSIEPDFSAKIGETPKRNHVSITVNSFAFWWLLVFDDKEQYTSEIYLERIASAHMVGPHGTTTLEEAKRSGTVEAASAWCREWELAEGRAVGPLALPLTLRPYATSGFRTDLPSPEYMGFLTEGHYLDKIPQATLDAYRTIARQAEQASGSPSAGPGLGTIMKILLLAVVLFTNVAAMPHGGALDFYSVLAISGVVAIAIGTGTGPFFYSKKEHDILANELLKTNIKLGFLQIICRISIVIASGAALYVLASFVNGAALRPLVFWMIGGGYLLSLISICLMPRYEEYKNRILRYRQAAKNLRQFLGEAVMKNGKAIAGDRLRYVESLRDFAEALVLLNNRGVTVINDMTVDFVGKIIKVSHISEGENNTKEVKIEDLIKVAVGEKSPLEAEKPAVRRKDRRRFLFGAGAAIAALKILSGDDHVSAGTAPETADRLYSAFKRLLQDQDPSVTPGIKFQRIAGLLGIDTGLFDQMVERLYAETLTGPSQAVQDAIQARREWERLVLLALNKVAKGDTDAGYETITDIDTIPEPSDKAGYATATDQIEIPDAVSFLSYLARSSDTPVRGLILSHMRAAANIPAVKGMPVRLSDTDLGNGWDALMTAAVEKNPDKLVRLTIERLRAEGKVLIQKNPVFRTVLAAYILSLDPADPWARQVLVEALISKTPVSQHYIRMAQDTLPLAVDLLDGNGIEEKNVRMLVRMGLYSVIALYGGPAAPYLGGLLLDSAAGTMSQGFLVQLLMDVSREEQNIQREVLKGLQRVQADLTQKMPKQARWVELKCKQVIERLKGRAERIDEWIRGAGQKGAGRLSGTPETRRGAAQGAVLPAVLVGAAGEYKRELTDMSPDEILALGYPGNEELKKHITNCAAYADVAGRKLGLSNADRHLLKVISFAHDIGGVLGDAIPESIETSIKDLAEEHGIETYGRPSDEVIKEFRDKHVELSPEQIAFMPRMDHAANSLRILAAHNIRVPPEAEILIRYHGRLRKEGAAVIRKGPFTDLRKEEIFRMMACFTTGNVFDFGNNFFKRQDPGLPAEKKQPFETPKGTMDYLCGHFKDLGMSQGIIDQIASLLDDNGFLALIERSRMPLAEFLKQPAVAVDRPASPAVPGMSLSSEQINEMFGRVTSNITNLRARLVHEANAVNAALKLPIPALRTDQPTAELIRDMRSIAETDDTQTAEKRKYIADNLDELAGNAVIASAIVLARRAKRENRKMTLAVEFDWIPGYNKLAENANPAQRSGVSKIAAALRELPDAFRRMGLDIEVIMKKNAETSAAWADRIVQEKGADLSGMVFFAGKTTVDYIKDKKLDGVAENNRPFLAGIDPEKILKSKKAVAEEYLVNILEMLLVTLELAAGGKKPEEIPLEFRYDPRHKLIIFLPDAEPVAIDKLPDQYRRQALALVAA